MGSFCIQCGVSGQVIADNDECVVVPIQQQSTYRPVEMRLGGKDYSLFGVCHTTTNPGSFWAPYGGGVVTASYVDYGRVEPHDTPTNRIAMAEFFHTLLGRSPVVSEGENKYHEPPFDLGAFLAKEAPTVLSTINKGSNYEPIASFTGYFGELLKVWNYVWDVMDDRRLFARDWQQQIRPVMFSAFHKESFDYLVKYARSKTDWSGKSYQLESVIQYAIAEMNEDLSKLTAVESENRTFFRRERILERLSLYLDAECKPVHNLYREKIRDLLDAHLDTGLGVSEMLNQLTPLMEGTYMAAGMSAINLKFTPISYAGQDYDNSAGKAYAKFIRTVSAQVSRKRAEWSRA